MSIGVSEDDIYQWGARRFYYKQIYLAWKAHTENKRVKALMKK